MNRLLFLYIFFLGIFPCHAKDSETDKQKYDRMAAVLKSKTGEYFQRTVRREGNKTVNWEAFIALEADKTRVPEILSNFSQLPFWTIRNINLKPGGGTYRLQIVELKTDAKDPSLLNAEFLLNVPAFHQNINRQFKLAAIRDKEVFTLRGESLPNDSSVIESVQAVMQVYPAEKHPGYVWIYASADIKIKYWLLYEALPERLLKNESGERIQILLDNYVAEETRLKSSQTPIKRTAAPDETMSLRPQE